MEKNKTGSLPNVIKIIEKNGRRIIMTGVRKDFPPKNLKQKQKQNDELDYTKSKVFYSIMNTSDTFNRHTKDWKRLL